MLPAAAEVADMDNPVATGRPSRGSRFPAQAVSPRGFRSRSGESWFSVGFVEAPVEHVGLFFVAMKAGAQRFIVDARASNRYLPKPPSGPLFTSERLCHVEFQGAPEDAQNWFVGSADIKNAFRQMRAFFALPAVIASEIGYTRKRSTKNVLLPILRYILFLQHFQCVLLRRCFSVRISRTTARSREVLVVLFLFVVTTPHNRCWVTNVAWDPGVQKACLDVHDTSLGSGSADVLGYEVSPANACCSGTVKRFSRIHSVVRTVSSRRRIGGQAMELVNGHESLLALSNRGSLISILDARL